MTQLTHTDTGNCLVICQHCGKVTQVQCKDAAQARCNIMTCDKATDGCLEPRPATSSRIETTKCFDDIVYSSTPWKIYRQDAGMGEHDYAVFLNGVFLCRTENDKDAHDIMWAIRGRDTRRAEAAAQAREDMMKLICEQCPVRNEEMPLEDYSAESCEGCLTHKVYESLRTGGERR